MIKTSDEGTSYCMQCEAYARKTEATLRVAENMQKRLGKLEAVARAAERYRRIHDGPTYDELGEALAALDAKP